LFFGCSAKKIIFVACHEKGMLSEACSKKRIFVACHEKGVLSAACSKKENLRGVPRKGRVI
jgi:hypothetical protein